MKVILIKVSMIEIEKVGANDIVKFEIIRAIAQEVWPVTFEAILSEEQIDYMLEMMYSITTLQNQANKKDSIFILATENEIPVGFAAYEFNYNKKSKTKIHKIYILPNQQGKGIGKKLINFIALESQKHNDIAIFLNVNKFNTAIHFYTKIGFAKVKEEIIDIGNGYVMDDYVMVKMLK